MSRRAPTSWEDDDWSHPASGSNAASNPYAGSSNPYTASSGLYNPASSSGPVLLSRGGSHTDSRTNPHPSSHTGSHTGSHNGPHNGSHNGPGPTLLRTGATAGVLYNPNEPEIVLNTNSAQPRTLYKPELTILKRDTTSRASGSREVKSAGGVTREERERERREKERRYREVKERIFAEGKTVGGAADGNAGNVGGDVVNGNGIGRGQAGKRGGRGSGSSTPKNGARTPRHQSSPSQSSQPQPQSQSQPQPQQSTSRGSSNPSSQPKAAAKPISTGAITGFSLNSGTLSAPVKPKERSEWQLRQVALDGKMLESQAQQYGFGQNEELLGDRENGLDWDEFRRDRWGGERRGEGQGTSYAEGYGTTGSYDARRYNEPQNHGGGYGQDLRGDYTRGYVQDSRDYAAGGYSRDIPQDAMEYAQKTQDLGDRFNNLDLIGFGESADPMDKPIPVSMGIVSRRDGAQVPVREPRGPDGAGGRGFASRGRGRGGLMHRTTDNSS